VVERSDDDLLVATPRDPAAFGEFYRRHVHALAGYFVLRTGNAEMAADLTAETFARALRHARRFDPAKGPAVGWLFGIARRQLSDARTRGRVDDHARRRLGVPRIELDDESIAAIEASAGSPVAQLLEELPADQRAAIEARVLAERDYAEIAADAGVPEAAIRKRVSRGLAAMRARLGEERQ
jgi:RNA polymerase sigma-70 factor (ECF subfamily)